MKATSPVSVSAVLSLTLLGGLTWGVQSTLAGNPNSTAALTDARRNVNAPSYALVNTGLSYTWNAASIRTRHTVRLSAKNLFDRDYVDQRGNLGVGRGVYFAYTLSH